MSDIVETAERASVTEPSPAEVIHQEKVRAIVRVQAAFRAVEDMMLAACPDAKLTALYAAERQCVAILAFAPNTVAPGHPEPEPEPTIPEPAT